MDYALKMLRAVPALVVVAVGGLLLLLESDFLWKAQELNLFLNTRLFLEEQLVVPGGLLTWAGTFFTQFFYHPWAGVLLLAAWWLLLAWLTKRTFRLSGPWLLLTVVPVLLILTTIVDMGYWLYVLKLRGHLFVTTIATTGVTALLWLFRRLIAHRYSSSSFRLTVTAAYVLLATVAGYPLMGIYGLAATLLMALWAWRLSDSRALALTVSGVAMASVIAVPLTYYRYVFHQTNIVNIYYAALPLFRIQEDYKQYYVPYFLLLLFFVLLACLSGRPFHGQNTVRPATVKPSMRTTIRGWAAAGSLLVAAIAYTAGEWYRDDNFHRELAMQRCMERHDWEGALQAASAQRDEPTRAIVVMRNIALAHLGRQASQMYHYGNGSQRSNAPFDMRMMMVSGPLAYYHYGLLNNCNRLCMEMGVEFGWRAEHLKYMARCAILNGELKAARKYLQMLKHTMFFSQWAAQMEQLCTPTTDRQAAATFAQSAAPEMEFVAHMMHYDDALKADNGFVELFIMRRLAYSTNADDPVFVEQALLATLFMRDARLFWRHLADYAMLHPGKQLPVHIQEAAMLFGMEGNRTDVDSWPLDESVKKSFRRFCETMPRYDDMEAGPVRKALAPEFGHTYYYDYYLMSDLPQY